MLLSAEELEYAKQSSQAVPGANRRSGDAGGRGAEHCFLAADGHVQIETGGGPGDETPSSTNSGTNAA